MTQAEITISNDFIIPVTEGFLAGMSFFEVWWRCYEQGAVAVIADTDAKKVVNFGVWQKDVNESFVDFFDEVERKHQLLFSRVKIVRRMWSGRLFTYVHEDYLPAAPEKLLQLLHDMPKTTYNISTRKSFENHLVFAEPALPHFHLVWTESMFTGLHKSLPNNKHKVVLIFDDVWMTFLAWSSNDLKLHTIYHAEKVQDAAFFVLYALEQLKIPATEADCYFAGAVLDVPALKEVMERFVQHIRPLPITAYSLSSVLSEQGIPDSCISIETQSYANS